MPKPKIALSGQARDIRKNRLKKVAKYKLHSQHKKALRDLGEGAGPSSQHAWQPAPAEAPQPQPQQHSQPPHAQAPWRAADGSRASRAPKKRKKVGALAAARGKWERSQVAVTATHEAAQQAAAERREAQEAARRRRSEQTSKLKKRTKRGQPVLGNMVDRYLSQLEGGR